MLLHRRRRPTAARRAIELRARPGRAPGFSTVELIVAIAVAALLVGAAVPVTAKLLTYKARKATREQLHSLCQASAAYFRDTHRLPEAIDALRADPGAAGWAGPYLRGGADEPAADASGHELDAWSRAYEFTLDGDVLTIASAAEGAAFGDADDLSVELDVTWIRREETLAELRLLNRAIAQYNAQHQASEPLSTGWSKALDQLVSTGFLPGRAEYEVDGWGAGYVADPPGVTPLVRVGSPSMRPASPAAR